MLDSQVKYIRLRKGTPEKMRLAIYAYQNLAFQKGLQERFRFFNPEELPTCQSDITQYQARSANKFTQLHVAILTDSQVNVQELVNNLHLDFNAKDINNLSPFDLAFNSKKFEILEILIRSKRMQYNHQEILKFAYHTRNIPLLDTLLKSDLKGSEGMLFHALVEKEEDVEIARLLIERGVNVNDSKNILIEGKYWVFAKTSFQVALERKQYDLIQLMFDHGAVINSAEMSIIMNDSELIKYMLENYESKIPTKYPFGDMYAEELLYEQLCEGWKRALIKSLLKRKDTCLINSNILLNPIAAHNLIVEDNSLLEKVDLLQLCIVRFPLQIDHLIRFKSIA